MALADEFNAAEQITRLQTALTNAQRSLVREKDRSAALTDAVVTSAADAAVALGPIRPVPRPNLKRPKGSRVGGEEVALWHVTDLQGSKVTTSYNSDVMVERVERFTRHAFRITEMVRAARPVNDCVIMFGGDMIEGLFNYPTQPFEVDQTLFGQFVTVARLLADTVRSALAVYDRVAVVAEWGNHGRLGSKRDAVPRSDNADRMTYALARAHLSEDIAAGRLTWDDSPEDIQRVQIGNYRALLIHGDEIGRNGFASPMTMVRHADRWRSGAYPWEFRDVYVGHYHTHAEWPMANGNGSVFQTGSTESDNRYARETMAASAVPSQRLHFIDPERGRVAAMYKVWLAEDN